MTRPEGVAEARRALGQQLAARRKAAGLSQQQLASLTDYSRSTIANVETGRQRVPRAFWEGCDSTLGTGTVFSRGYDEVVTVQRLGHMATAAAAQQTRIAIDHSVSLGAPAWPGSRSADAVDGPLKLDHIESVRLRLASALAEGTASGADPDAWEQTVLWIGQATRNRPPGELVIGLAADLAELEAAIRRCHSALALRRLVRAAANMSGLMCLLYVKLDERAAFRRWADTARAAAAEAGDSGTFAWVLAQEAYGHYYSGDSVNAIRVARHAQGLMHRTPSVGAALAAALEARAHATRGDARETRRALGRAETVLAALEPGSVTASAFGYAESQFRFHEGSAYTRLRDFRSAWAAQERALQICPPADYTDRALTRLDRATCLAQSGDIDGAATYAAETLAALGAEQRHGIIALRGRDLLRAVPARYRAATAVHEIQELLTEDRPAKEAPCP